MLSYWNHLHARLDLGLDQSFEVKIQEEFVSLWKCLVLSLLTGTDRGLSLATYLLNYWPQNKFLAAQDLPYHTSVIPSTGSPNSKIGTI